MTKFYFWLDNLAACTDALRWVNGSRYRSQQRAWRECTRSDWMLWLLIRCSSLKGWPSLKRVLAIIDPDAYKEEYKKRDTWRLACLFAGGGWTVISALPTPQEIRKIFPEIGPITFDLKRGHGSGWDVIQCRELKKIMKTRWK